MMTSSLWDEREPPSASFDEALDRLLVAVMDEPSEKPPPKARPLWPPRADDTVLDEGLGDEDELESLITVRTWHVPEAPAPIPAEPVAIPAEPGPELSEELELEDDQPTIVLTTHQIMLMKNVSDAPEPAAVPVRPRSEPAPHWPRFQNGGTMDWMKTRRAAWRALSTLAFTFLIGGAASPASAANVAKIVNSGPDAEKLVVAVLADGYTTDEMDRFADDAKRLVVDGLFMQDFFHANSSAFNVYRVDLPSNESGVSQRVYDETGTPSDASDDTIISTTMRDTALRYIYSGSWAHCWMEASADTGALLQDALEAHLPNYDYVLILLNEDGFGGCAGGNRMVATRSSGWSVVAHELGHGLGGLYDEYSKEGTEWSGSTLNTKNCSTVLDRDKVVWHDLIEDTTAIPTVYATGTDPNRTVGMFEGCKTVRSGIYRPVHNCRMNGNSPPFCPVCDRIMKQAVQPYLDGPEDNTLAASYPGALCRAVDSEALRLLSSGELSNAGSEAAQIDCLFRRTFDGTTATLYAVAAAWVTDQHPTEDVCCTLYSKNPGGAKRQGETACSSGAHGSYQILSLNFPKLYDPYSWSHFYLSCRIPGTSDSSRSFIRTFRITQQNF